MIRFLDLAPAMPDGMAGAGPSTEEDPSVANFTYPPDVYIVSLNEERRGYVNRRAKAADKSDEAKALDARIAAVDEAIALHEARKAGGDAPAEAPAE